ncbi:GAF and ANTAR domain-containing protein [Mycobacterium sp. 21AC1]|uniref:GAF and ANTAR domain-containing protein n=1 Tax=[Mycobacterium] appelbergii TaxID=2939269 RepID=UPI002938D494|nr:GAF and ANTAR domain-containing protein [Mycobacterium sp. 21AC1]MDV3123567.1 GAF and ANTAR domain-containing protein [Mycobacterium sp. 21AC1]
MKDGMMANQHADQDAIRSAMAELAENFVGSTDIDSILESVTSHAVELIGGVDVADVLLIDGQRYRSMAATDEIATRLDKLQIELHEGPCLDAAAENPVILSPDLTSDLRWPNFAAAAVEEGVSSMMSFRLYSYAKQRNGVGGTAALNMLSRTRSDFSLEDQAVGAMLATHAASALIAADRQTQFESALASRDVLGQAKGILMERFKVDAVEAFGLLVKLSQDSNTLVRTVAQRIVEST